MAEVTKLLKNVFLAHGIVGLLFGVIYLVHPAGYMGLLGWTVLESYIYQILGAAMIGIAVSSLLAYRDPMWDKVKIIVEMEMVWLVFADIILILAGTIGPYPPTIWLNIVLFLVFTILFIYCYIQNLD